MAASTALFGRFPEISSENRDRLGLSFKVVSFGQHLQIYRLIGLSKKPAPNQEQG